MFAFSLLKPQADPSGGLAVDLTLRPTTVMLTTRDTGTAPRPRPSHLLATICTREHTWRVPYGVVKLDNRGHCAEIEEKPLRREMISAGIYALSPEVLAHVPAEGVCDMPTLLSTLSEQISPVAVFPLREYWLDIGHLDDLRRAQDDINNVFL